MLLKDPLHVMELLLPTIGLFFNSRKFHSLPKRVPQTFFRLSESSLTLDYGPETKLGKIFNIYPRMNFGYAKGFTPDVSSFNNKHAHS